MPPSKDVRDHWQAGVALVYGEIAELLTRVEKLREDVPNLVAAGTRELHTSIIAIVKATKGAQVTIDQLVAAEEKRLAEVGTKERQALEDAARRLLEALQIAQAGLQQSQATSRSPWLWFALGVGVFLLSAAGAYVGVTLAR